MRTTLLHLFRHIKLNGSFTRPKDIIKLLTGFIRRLLANPQIAELWRFIFLGTVVEAGRVAGQKLVDFVSSCELSPPSTEHHQLRTFLCLVFMVCLASPRRLGALAGKRV